MASARPPRRRARTARSTATSPNGKTPRISYRERDNLVALAVIRIGGIQPAQRLLGRSRKHVSQLCKDGPPVRSARDCALLAMYGQVSFADLAGVATVKRS